METNDGMTSADLRNTQDGWRCSAEGPRETCFTDVRMRLDLRPISFSQMQCPEDRDISQLPPHPLNSARTWKQEASVSGRMQGASGDRDHVFGVSTHDAYVSPSAS